MRVLVLHWLSQKGKGSDKGIAHLLDFCCVSHCGSGSREADSGECNLALGGR